MKKTGLILALAVLAVVQTAVYWNAHLFYRALDGAADPGEKMRLLGLAARIYPWNERVYFELGRVSFERGAESMAESRLRDEAIRDSARYFLKSLWLDPASAAAHLHLAQSLQYMDYLSLPMPVPYFEEYKKAASLTGHNSQVHAEVGRVLLARWESLRPEEKDFTLDLLKKVLAGKDPARLRDILEIWYLGGRDEAVIDQILPEDSGLARAYAEFLGEKSLSLEARERALARAESLDFASARNELEAGQRNLESFESEQAAAHASACLKLLGSIAFYQGLVRGEMIDPREYAQVRKAAHLLLAKSRIEQTGTLDDPDSSMATYVAQEDQPLSVGGFEQFLRERGLLEGDGSAASRPKDLRVLALEMSLDFKQNRYRDITKAGEILERSTFIIPEAGRAYYARILGLIGDSYMKLDYLYEAEKFYLKALSAGPEKPEDLLRLERCYARLNNDRKLAEVHTRLDALLLPPRVSLGGRPLEKGSPVRIAIVSDGQPMSLTVSFESSRPGSRPLLAAFWNGRVVHEAYAEGNRFTFPVNPTAGTNSLVLETVNTPVTLLELERKPGPGGN
jgi:tetratricopeptide (TPR) repeat protein